MDFLVLGPVAVLAAGQPVRLGGPKQRLVMAVLILGANRVVSAERLIEQVWGDAAPETARGTLQAYISRLRKALGSERIEARAPGYVLQAERDEVDADRFERLVVDSQRRLESDPQAAVRLLDTALSIWRGAAVEDLATEPALRAQAARLDELRLTAIGRRVEAKLALGRHQDLVPELERLVREHPLREPFWAALLLALYRSDRKAEALATFERARGTVGEQLGVDPSEMLRRLHERILRQDPELDQKGRRLRGYEVQERIGEGANATVYHAIQPTLKREVAVKVIHRRLANQPEFVRRFEQEAQIIARLEHPHIVPLYDYWREPDSAYLAMRYLPGGSLKQYLETKGPLNPAEAVRIVEQVGSALALAHRQGVVHRDVRPANILFDDDGNAYLSDFGIAVEVSAGGGARRRPGDDAHYIAPEQVRGESATPATDIYCLGLVLHEALTGRLTWGEVRAGELEPDYANPATPESVREVVARATEKDPAARYPDVASLTAAFKAAVEGGWVRPTPPTSIARNPYKGLRPFDEADASDFFGRQQLTAQLVSHLSETGNAARFIAVVGPSGCGKSSAVRAGLVPAIRCGGVPGSERWFVVEMQPGVQPFEELERALLRIAVSHPPSLLDELESGGRGLLQALEQVLPRDGSELLIVVDQFEELFTLVPDERCRDAFLEAIAVAVSDPESRVRVVVTLRADFYDRPLLHPRFGELLARRTVAVTPMLGEELELAISGPLESSGIAFESGLIGAIVSDVRAQAGSMPLLQYALTELFDLRAGSTLTLDSYRRIGGISGALSGRAEALYRRLDDSAKTAARQVFLRLVTLGEPGSADSRRRVLRSEFAALGVERTAIDLVTDQFGSHRLLTFDRDPATREPTVEVAHEALLLSWRRLRGWIDEYRDDLRTHRRLAADAHEWSAAGRDPSHLLRGSRLEQFDSWVRATSVVMAGLEREFLEASLTAREADRTREREQVRREAVLRKRSTDRLRSLVAVLLVGVLTAGSLALIAQDQGARAEQQARLATARELAAAAVANVGVDTEKSLLLALQAVETTRQVDGSVLNEAQEALHAALQAHRLVVTAPGYRGRFSADGARLLIDGSNGSSIFAAEADVRDAATGRLLLSQVVRGIDQARFLSTQLVFSPDGTRFADASDGSGGGSDDYEVAVYDTATGNRLWKWGACCGWFTITPDGRLVITSDETATYAFDLETGRLVTRYPAAPCRGLGFESAEGVCPIWEVAPDGRRTLVTDGAWHEDLGAFVAAFVRDGTHVTRLLGQGDVNGAGWSSDGATVATSNQDSVVVWDARTGQPRLSFFPPTGRFTTLAFGHDPTLVATGMNDGSAILWRLTAGSATPILKLARHAGEIRSLAFSSDGMRLMTGGDDGRIRVWDVTATGGGESLSVAGAGGFDFSRGGRFLAVGADTGHVDLYETRDGRRVLDFRPHTQNVDVVALDARGSRLATASSDGSVKLSDAQSGSVMWARARTGRNGVAISPDGTLVAMAIEGAVDVMDGRTGDVLRALEISATDQSADRVGQTIAFSSNGKFLAAGGSDWVYVWRVGDWQRVELDQIFVEALSFSPAGRRIVTSGPPGLSGAAPVWDTLTGTQLGWLVGVPRVTGVAFSPDGSRIATSSADGRLTLWDAANLRQLYTLARDANGQLVFTADGTGLAYAAEGGVVRVLALRIEGLVRLAHTRLGRMLTTSECRQYLHLDSCPPSSVFVPGTP